MPRARNPRAIFEGQVAEVNPRTYAGRDGQRMPCVFVEVDQPGGVWFEAAAFNAVVIEQLSNAMGSNVRLECEVSTRNGELSLVCVAATFPQLQSVPQPAQAAVGA